MKQKTKAFTLVESIIAITIMVVTMTGVSGLIISTIRAHDLNLHQIQAVAYAQEGIEGMRYLRDSNWRQNLNWTGSNNQSVGGLQFGLEDSKGKIFYLKSTSQLPFWELSGFEGDGEFETRTGLKLSREIQVEPLVLDGVAIDPTEALQIRSIVTWEEKGRPVEFELSTILSDWQ